MDISPCFLGMSELPEKQPEQKPTPNQETVDDLLWEIPFARPIWKFFVREGKAVKNGWVAVAVVVGITVWITYSKTAAGIDARVSGLTNYFNGEISGLKGQLSEAKQDRDKYQMLLAPFEAMAISKYTNAPMDQRLDLLITGMVAITNALGSLHTDIPSFELRVNDSTNLIAGGSVVALSNAREIRLWVRNIGEATAENLTIAFSAPVSSPDLNFSSWRPQAGIVKLNTMEKLDWIGEWRIVSDQSVAIGEAFEAPPLILSKNLPSPSFTVSAAHQVFGRAGSIRLNLPTNTILPALPVEIGIYSDRSKIQIFDLFLTY